MERNHEDIPTNMDISEFTSAMTASEIYFFININKSNARNFL